MPQSRTYTHCSDSRLEITLAFIPYISRFNVHDDERGHEHLKQSRTVCWIPPCRKFYQRFDSCGSAGTGLRMTCGVIGVGIDKFSSIDFPHRRLWDRKCPQSRLTSKRRVPKIPNFLQGQGVDSVVQPLDGPLQESKAPISTSVHGIGKENKVNPGICTANSIVSAERKPVDSQHCPRLR